MTDPQEALTAVADAADPAGMGQRLLVVNPPANRSVPREGRAVTNLSAVFGRLAEAQHLVGDQVIALEDQVAQQGQQLVEVASQLPDMKERINWLIASYYENDRQSQSVRDRLARQEAGLATLTEAVRGLCEAQVQWRQTMDRLLQILGSAQVAPVPAPPRWPAEQ